MTKSSLAGLLVGLVAFAGVCYGATTTLSVVVGGSTTPPPTGLAAPVTAAHNYGSDCSGTCLVSEDTFTSPKLNTIFWNPFMADGTGGRWDDQGNLAAPYSAFNCPGGSCPGHITVEYGDPYSYGYSTPIDTVHMGGGNGVLSLTAVPDSHFASKGYSWSSAYVTTGGHPAMMCPTTGCFIQVRAKSPDRRFGAWPAIWMLPGSSGTGGNEFDISDGAINSTSTNANTRSGSTWYGCGSTTEHLWATPGNVDVTADYHVYGLQYIPNVSFTVYFDGAVMATFPFTCTVNSNFELILSMQVAGAGSKGYYPQLDGVHNGPFEWDINDVQIYKIPGS